MKIRCWGSRGSIAVSGRQYLKYGGDTTCVEVRSDTGDVIIIDGGTGLRPCGNALMDEEPRTLSMLFTHAHWDHLMGIGFFRPLFNAQYAINIYGYRDGQKSFRSILQGVLSEPYFPIRLGDRDFRARIRFRDIATRPFTIGSLRIQPILLNHPRNSGLGFRFEEGDTTFVFLTDNELDFQHNGGRTFEDYVKFCHGADLLIHDGEYDETDYRANRGWGHSLYLDTVELGLQAQVGMLGLFHLNNMKTDRQIDQMVKKANTVIKRAHSSMSCCAIGAGFSITL